MLLGSCLNAQNKYGCSNGSYPCVLALTYRIGVTICQPNATPKVLGLALGTNFVTRHYLFGLTDPIINVFCSMYSSVAVSKLVKDLGVQTDNALSLILLSALIYMTRRPFEYLSKSAFIILYGVCQLVCQTLCHLSTI